MRNEYYEIYEDFYDSYRRGPLNSRFAEEFFFEYDPLQYFRSIRWTTNAIEKSISRLGLVDQVRPDAKHFLLVNLHQLIVLPIMHPEVEKMNHEKLTNILHHDATLILKTASTEIENHNQDQGRGEISGGLLLKTISNIWDKLELNSLDIWG